MMHKVILIILSFVVFSCSDKTVEEPEKIIDPETMEKILYDLAMLQSIRGYSYSKLTENSINPKTYIYQKYKIDSAQFAQNNKYYSADIVAYKKMYNNVITRITEEKKVVDTIISKEAKKLATKNDSIEKSSDTLSKKNKF